MSTGQSKKYPKCIYLLILSVARRTQEAVHLKKPLTTVTGNNLHFTPIIQPSSSLFSPLSVIWLFSPYFFQGVQVEVVVMFVSSDSIYLFYFFHTILVWLIFLVSWDHQEVCIKSDNFLDSEVCIMISKFCLNKSQKFKSKIFTSECELIA